MRFYRHLRRKISAAGLLPRGVLARITGYLCAIVLLLLIAEAVSSALRRPSTAHAFGAWAEVLAYPAAILFLIVLIKLFRQRVLWRLRNRLIVTYVFIGVIPIALLLAMMLLAGKYLAGQFAAYLVTADLRAQVSSLAAENGEIAAQLAVEMRNGVAPDTAANVLRASDRFSRAPQRTTMFWYGAREFEVHRRVDESHVNPPPAWLVHEAESNRLAEFEDIVWTGKELRFTALRVLRVGSERLIVGSHEPLNNSALAQLAGNLGVVSIGHGETGAPLAAGGSLPGGSWLNFAYTLITPLRVRDWNTGAALDNDFGLIVTTRNSLLYERLGTALGRASGAFLVWLTAIGALFTVIELFALLVGVRLTRSITAAVYDLYEATLRVNRGDFSRRIPIRSTDQLAALETSFNDMTGSLQRLLAEQKEKQRIEGDLAIAQEVQNQLFPSHIAQLESLEVYGTCRPARTVSGDYYDFLPLGPEQLTIAVGDISGKGISAALLMATLHSAVRSFLVLHARERASQPALALAAAGQSTSVTDENAAPELSPSQWLTLLNAHLFHSTPASKYATLFLGEYDGHTRRLTYSNGGHLAPLVLTPGGGVRRLETGGMVVGLFDAMRYEEESVTLKPGDIFIAYSDGITEPENEFGEFGEERLIELIRENSDLPLARIADEVLTAVNDWIGGAEQPDDMTLVFARVR